MFCQECPTKSTCKEICKPLENYLSKNPDGYSERHIRRKEIPYGNMADMDNTASHRAFMLKYGKSYFKVRNATDNVVKRKAVE